MSQTMKKVPKRTPDLRSKCIIVDNWPSNVKRSKYQVTQVRGVREFFNVNISLLKKINKSDRLIKMGT